MAGDVGSKIAGLLGIDATTAGKGMTFPLGAMVALSGPALSFGTNQVMGAQLAIKHILAAGGPTFTLTAKDDKSANATAGAQISRELGEAHVQMVLGADAEPGEIANIAQYEMLTIDGAAGIIPGATAGKPFIWGSKAISPDQSYPGMAKYVAAKFNGKKLVAVIMGGQNANIQHSHDVITQAFGAAGVNVGQIINGPGFGTTTDFSSLISDIQNAKPELLNIQMYGADVGNFMKQYATSGLTAPVIGVDFTEAAQQIAGSALNGYLFSDDFFVESANPWAQIFGPEYKTAYHTDAIDISANAYEDVFVFWDLIRRVLQANGTVSGSALQQALMANPTFASLYGPGTKTGTMTFDTASHGLAHRAMGMFKFENGTSQTLATYDLDGSQFQLAS